VTSYASTASKVNSMNSWPMPTKMSPWTNVERPPWIYLLRGGVNPYPHCRLNKSRLLRCLCWGYSSGATLDLRNCDLQSKAIINTLTLPARRTPNASPFLQSIQPILSSGARVIIPQSVRWASIKHSFPSHSCRDPRTFTVAGILPELHQACLILRLKAAVSPCVPSTTSI